MRDFHETGAVWGRLNMKSNAEERFDAAVDEMVAECVKVGGNTLSALAWATQEMPTLPWENDAAVRDECIRVLKDRMTPEEREIWRLYMRDEAPAVLVAAIERKHGRYLMTPEQIVRNAA